MKHRALLPLLCLYLTGSAGMALASGDPTRPPGGFLGGPDATQAADGMADSAPLRLQMVKTPAGGKPYAVINGEVRHVGETFGEFRLIRLSAREAVLRGPNGLEHLPLVDRSFIKRHPDGPTQPGKP